MPNVASLNRNVDVFISYSSRDEEIANMVVEGLTARGVKCWKAGTFTINSGEDFRQKIAEALDECKIFLLILSKDSMASPWVKLELTEALYKNKKIYSLKVDDGAIDELFDFKLGCSQISDGTKNLVAVVENLSINVKKDRDALLEKEKTQIYSSVKGYHFFNLSLLNTICMALFLLLTAVRAVAAYRNPPVWEEPLRFALEQVKPCILALVIYLFIRVAFWSLTKKYARLGCPSAAYLTYKKESGLLCSAERKKKALALLQDAAKNGDHRALRRLAKAFQEGKLVNKDEEKAAEYLARAEEEKKGYLQKITKNKGCFALMIGCALFIVAVYCAAAFLL